MIPARMLLKVTQLHIMDYCYLRVTRGRTAHLLGDSASC